MKLWLLKNKQTGKYYRLLRKDYNGWNAITSNNVVVNQDHPLMSFPTLEGATQYIESVMERDEVWFDGDLTNPVCYDDPNDLTIIETTIEDENQ